jgi:hypothetical protein
MPAAVGLSSVETIIAVGRHVAEAVGRRRELPSASAGGGCTHTHTHTHTYSLRALGTSTGERRIHRRRRGRRQQRRQWEESWRVQQDKPHIRHGMG